MTMMLDTLKTLCLWYTACSLALHLHWETVFCYAIEVIATLFNRWFELTVIGLGAGLFLTMQCILCKLGNLEYRTRHLQTPPPPGPVKQVCIIYRVQQRN